MSWSLVGKCFVAGILGTFITLCAWHLLIDHAMFHAALRGAPQAAPAASPEAGK